MLHFLNSRIWEFGKLPDIKNIEDILSFLILVGPKQVASPSVFKELYDGGTLINLWNPQIFKT